ncbi:uncharacterized protein LOC128198877 [Bicyclus anynana]|uniref:Uncharacterized protein LOC128198877 n=1 Tax=Bicyclus anynana TaxID=110368 RepID=A0ABM3LTA1_BICAN|nr:uncharacterized protein LOC128198877 [Bicyclus anynana]
MDDCIIFLCLSEVSRDQDLKINKTLFISFQKIIYILLLVATVEIQSKELDPGPQPIAEGNSPQSPIHKRYATKEVILYLTPSQIRALQTGEGTISSSVLDESIREQELQKQQTLKQNEDLVREQFENIKSARVVIPVYEQQEENIKTVSENPSIKEEEPQIDSEKVINSLQELSQLKQYSPEIQREAWIAYNKASIKKQKESFNEQFKQKWDKILELNRRQLKVLSEQSSQTKNTEEIVSLEKPILQLQYPTKYNDQKNAIEIEKLIRQEHQEELDRQSALVQAESIAKAPPKLIQQHVTITKHVPVYKHVKVPVPTPVLVPIPEPYRVNVPHPYPVPVEIFKQNPEPVGARNNKDEKLSHVSLSEQSKEDRSFIVQKYVPFTYETENEAPVGIPTHRTKKVSILRPIWKH